jgi:hypothetical protein
MANSTRSARDRRVEQLAADYRQRGFVVTIEPSADKLPEFLRPFRPDLIAKGPDESVVVEVKSRNTLDLGDRWSRLTDTIRQHPDWRLELIGVNDNGQDEAETITRTQIEARLAEGSQLAREGHIDASLLILWSAAEAAMRLAGAKHDVELPDFRPGTVISRLFMEGILGREDYDVLLRVMQRRNRVAHGFREGKLHPSNIRQLQDITQRLLQ